MIALRVPAGKTGFKGRIGNAVDAVRDVEDLNIIEQALAFEESSRVVPRLRRTARVDAAMKSTRDHRV